MKTNHISWTRMYYMASNPQLSLDARYEIVRAMQALRRDKHEKNNHTPSEARHGAS